MTDTPNFYDDIDADLNHINSVYPNYDQFNSSHYYSYDNINSAYNNNRISFSVAHFNICFLYPKIDEILAELSSLKFSFDVMIFTESWLTVHTVNLVSFDHYNMFNNLRVDRRGGGISVFVSEKYKTSIISDFTLSTTNTESLFMEIALGSNRVLCGAIYRPPSGNCDIFIQDLQRILSSINRNHYKEILLAGDFNFDLVVLNQNHVVQLFVNTLHSYSLFPIISKPTRVTNNTASLIDNIFFYLNRLIISRVLCCPRLVTTTQFSVCLGTCLSIMCILVKFHIHIVKLINIPSLLYMIPSAYVISLVYQNAKMLMLQ